jgi:hypothetical protein
MNFMYGREVGDILHRRHADSSAAGRHTIVIEAEDKERFVEPLATALQKAGLYASTCDYCHRAARRMLTELHRQNCYVGHYLNGTIEDPDL